MIEISTLFILCALVAVAISWAVPASFALDAVALWTAIVLFAVAPVSALWLLASAVLTSPVLQLAERFGHRGLIGGLWSGIILSAFVASRMAPGIIWVGGAFFTLRTLHVVGDWWMGRLAVPTIRSQLRYHLFLPVLFVGPIHRIEIFERQSERRRWDSRNFFEGMERTLVGAFSAAVIGGWLISTHLEAQITGWTVHLNGFLGDWILTAVEWVSLYFIFAGLTAIALGISLMIGLRLEENFNRPWAARNLIDFWMRWHMSLTRWCRDYVFRPVAAFTRSALIGLVVGMLAVGLWHELSAYYVMWSAWQVLGIGVTRLSFRYLPCVKAPQLVRSVFGPIFVLGWLSLAKPIAIHVFGLAI